MPHYFGHEIKIQADGLLHPYVVSKELSRQSRTERYLKFFLKYAQHLCTIFTFFTVISKLKSPYCHCQGSVFLLSWLASWLPYCAVVQNFICTSWL